MEQKFKMQIQRLVKHAAAVLTAVTVGILSAAAVFSQNSNPVYGAENGIYLAGGGALLRGLDKRLTDKLNIQFHIAEDPLRAVARGTGIALKNVDKFSFLIR